MAVTTLQSCSWGNCEQVSLNMHIEGGGGGWRNQVCIYRLFLYIHTCMCLKLFTKLNSKAQAGERLNLNISSVILNSMLLNDYFTQRILNSLNQMKPFEGYGRFIWFWWFNVRKEGAQITSCSRRGWFLNIAGVILTQKISCGAFDCNRLDIHRIKRGGGRRGALRCAWVLRSRVRWSLCSHTFCYW